ncbi:hypothetical protein ACJJIW_01515 [Microbulbifer sp. JMSA004]|uniref:hypothetical protein n=1 Tax=Microbulbifer sp. JMSA004 TaxID=3243370 RepID=UPI00403A2D7C
MNRELALEIFNESILQNWYFYLLILLLSIVGAYIASMVKGFSKEKSKYLAIKASLRAIEKKIEITTKTSESIKTSIEHDFWRKRENESIRKKKLEEYYPCISSLNKNLNLELMSKLLNADVDYDECSFEKATMIQALYLPELIEEHLELSKIVEKYSRFISEGLFASALQTKNGVVNPRPTEDYMAKQGALNKELVTPIVKALEKARLVAKNANT